MEMSRLKALAPSNMKLVSVTAAVFQVRGWPPLLNFAVLLNMRIMWVTAAVFQLEMSWLKSAAPENM